VWVTSDEPQRVGTSGARRSWCLQCRNGGKAPGFPGTGLVGCGAKHGFRYSQHSAHCEKETVRRSGESEPGVGGIESLFAAGHQQSVITIGLMGHHCWRFGH